jgi:hypothetical protein
MGFPTLSIPASGTTFSQFQASGLSGMIETLIGVIAAATPTNNPTSAPTLSESGSGGTLGGNTYYGIFTEYNYLGETLPSPASSSQGITLGQDLIYTFPSLQSGNVGRRAYWGLSSTGPWYLGAEGITAGTLTVTAPFPGPGAGGSFADSPPTVNSTGLSVTQLSGLRAAKNGNLADVYRNVSRLLDQFNAPNYPIAYNQLSKKLRDAQFIFAALTSLIAEAGVLVNANPGSFTLNQTLLTGPFTSRVWP